MRAASTASHETAPFPQGKIHGSSRLVSPYFDYCDVESLNVEMAR